ncbi:MAG: hypothetical protein FWE13_05995 [Firmicutes bacterium]|nr:hypothetical protein [Bacillota bacterium]
MKRKRGEEAISIGFYITIGIMSLLTVIAIILYFLLGYTIQLDSSILGAIIGVAGALIGFLITLFALYFSFGMKEELKSILIEYGFYKQIPKDILRTVFIYAFSLLLAIVSYFFNNSENLSIIKVYDTLTILTISFFICAIFMTIFIVVRFFKIIFNNETF